MYIGMGKYERVSAGMVNKQTIFFSITKMYIGMGKYERVSAGTVSKMYIGIGL